ncbi:RNase Sy [Phycomyces nitens]|nr:RNase Sy [Phycomyces nitens]
MKLLATATSLFALSSLVSASPLLRARADTCSLTALSCSTSAASDSCCSPTYGLLVLVQQWLTGYGPTDEFTLHGLWPDTCSGAQTSSSGCDSSRAYSNVGSIVESGNSDLFDQMSTYWPSYTGDDSTFWTHEWDKHGTCVTTLDPACFGDSYTKYQDMYTYFAKVLELRSTYNLHDILADAGITPGGSYKATAMIAAIKKSTGFTPRITCTSGTLNEIWLYFNVKGASTYVPVAAVSSSTCSGTVKYPAKTV